MSVFSDDLAVSSLRKIWIELGELINADRSNVFESSELFQASRRSTPPASLSSDDATLLLAKGLYMLRRRRSQFFCETLFADPSWDILLDLYVRRCEGKRVSVKSVCIASGVPATTALRWISLLEKNGLVERNNDSADLRVRWINLSDLGFEKMHKLLLSLVEQKEVSYDFGSDRNVAREAR